MNVSAVAQDTARRLRWYLGANAGLYAQELQARATPPDAARAYRLQGVQDGIWMQALAGADLRFAGRWHLLGEGGLAALTFSSRYREQAGPAATFHYSTHGNTFEGWPLETVDHTARATVGMGTLAVLAGYSAGRWMLLAGGEGHVMAYTAGAPSSARVMVAPRLGLRYQSPACRLGAEASLRYLDLGTSTAYLPAGARSRGWVAGLGVVVRLGR